MQDEQTKQVKQQLIEQITSTFPADKKAIAIKQIESMNAEQLEEFLKQNNLVKEGGAPASPQGQQCIFCAIVQGKTPSSRIAENESAIAVLELNPVSKAHSLIIPKQHVTSPDDIPLEAQSLAQIVSKKIKETLNAKSVTIQIANMFGHEIINLIPVYDGEEPSQERKQATPEELEKLQKQLEILSEVSEKTSEEVSPEEPAEPEVLTDENTWLPRRIP